MTLLKENLETATGDGQEKKVLNEHQWMVSASSHCLDVHLKLGFFNWGEQ